MLFAAFTQSPKFLVLYMFDDLGEYVVYRIRGVRPRCAALPQGRRADRVSEVGRKPLSVDMRPCAPADRVTPLPKMAFGQTQYRLMGMEQQYGQLRSLCAANRMSWWNAYLPCYSWLYGSGLPYQFYSRDAVHSGELGKQILGHVMLGYSLAR